MAKRRRDQVDPLGRREQRAAVVARQSAQVVRPWPGGVEDRAAANRERLTGQPVLGVNGGDRAVRFIEIDGLDVVRQHGAVP